MALSGACTVAATVGAEVATASRLCRLQSRWPCRAHHPNRTDADSQYWALVRRRTLARTRPPREALNTICIASAPAPQRRTDRALPTGTVGWGAAAEVMAAAVAATWADGQAAAGRLLSPPARAVAMVLALG
eukprot:5602855-Prymnesium_polylepis.1